MADENIVSWAEVQDKFNILYSERPGSNSGIENKSVLWYNFCKKWKINAVYTKVFRTKTYGLAKIGNQVRVI